VYSNAQFERIIGTMTNCESRYKFEQVKSHATDLHYSIAVTYYVKNAVSEHHDDDDDDYDIVAP